MVWQSAACLAGLAPRVGTPALLTVLLLASLILTGCSSGEPASITGQVAYDGKPVTDGTLRLFPLGDTPGVGAEAAIVDGGYSIALERGLFAGRYRIEVRATKSGGPTELPEDAPGMPKPAQLRYEYIPERYNNQSSLEVELEPGGNQHHLDLQRDPQWEAEQQSEFSEWIDQAAKKG